MLSTASANVKGALSTPKVNLKVVLAKLCVILAKTQAKNRKNTRDAPVTEKRWNIAVDFAAFLGNRVTVLQNKSTSRVEILEACRLKCIGAWEWTRLQTQVLQGPAPNLLASFVILRGSHNAYVIWTLMALCPSYPARASYHG